MSDYIPEELIINILQRLTVKTLVRCTCVCKSWYTLITSPQSISTHLNFNYSCKKIAPLLLLRRCFINGDRYALHSDNESLKRVAKWDCPFEILDSFFTIIGSCNGLLCLCDDRVPTIIIWNPCIKKSVLLPKPKHNFIYYFLGKIRQSFGFGYDCVADDYKVVRITCVDHIAALAQVELYKLSAGVWQDISGLRLKHVVYSERRQANIHGANHWVARCRDGYDLIVLFDMCGEVFGEMRLPDILANNDHPVRKKDMVVYMESLAVIAWNASWMESSFCVWVMKEYGVVDSWTKHFNVEDSQCRWGDFIRPLWFRKCGEVMAVGETGHLISYGTDGEEVRDLGIRASRSEDYWGSVYVDSYMKSLVLLERGPGFCDAVTCSRVSALLEHDSDECSSCASDN